MIEFTHVEGKDKGKIVLYALSTCGWCRKTKKLLDSLGLAYNYIDVDLLSDADSDQAVAEVMKWNKHESYPTLVIDDKRAIINYDEEKITELAQ